MRIDWWTLGLQAVNVLVLIWILNRFLFRPITAIIAERRQAAAALLIDAQAEKARIEAEIRKSRDDAQKLADERRVQLQGAADEAEKAKASILDAARDEALQMHKAAEAEIARAHTAEAAALAERSAELAIDIAAKLLDRLPDDARVAGFVDGLAQALAALPTSARDQLCIPDGTLRIKAARALTDEEMAQCRLAISGALDRPITIAVDVDHTLIAGLEVDTPHASIRNSFRADLGRIAEELRAPRQ